VRKTKVRPGDQQRVTAESQRTTHQSVAMHRCRTHEPPVRTSGLRPKSRGCRPTSVGGGCEKWGIHVVGTLNRVESTAPTWTRPTGDLCPVEKPPPHSEG
jgi:hypothetical protein